ncbi:exodeoxyribonuclease V subunit alpha [Psychrobacter sp. Cmf 22.2]|uniref:exodeoxyribonuclease V subunit alpha n=1 Tax=Psychrobacter sp. Cmf 22.2 TaxID=1926478 RepID=UPI0009471318|nr:exodeoxyribonuclease V subunit alpha [Psychrobacter sp. Cmf 22.2]OLF38457.1 exodeoxyribonuclease V subunit alpha [Psychrobacter sp. Cmf 22.2]
MSKSTTESTDKSTNITQQVASSGQNQGAIVIGSSWATTISQYLLQRRGQTQAAYQAQLRLDESDINPATQDWLFEAIFEVLIQRLEEGHTVVILTDDDSQADLKLGSESYTELLSWQQQLIQPLLQPLLSQAASILGQVVDIDSLMSNKHALWNAALLQSTLTQYEQQILQQRYRAATELYQYLRTIAAADIEVSSINSLSKFIRTLKEHPLIQDSLNDFSKHSNNHNNSPIVFQVKENTQFDKQKLVLTLWLHRTWQAEYALARHIIRIKNQTVDTLPIASNPLLNTEQQDAIHMANRSAFSIITGGPGTGKTFTVAQLVMALHQAQSEGEIEDKVGEVSTNSVNLALAAPTGKAAQRMQESLQDALQHAGVAMQLPEAKTIHRLLGIGQGGQPRYHKDNQLSEDIVIVDEASMLGVELANYLVSAVKPKARLILLGDANQLAAVDAGAVLADLCRIPALQDVHQRLEVSRRFTKESGIGKLAKLINQDASEVESSMTTVWQLMREDETLDFYHLTHTPSTQIENDINNKDNTIKNSLSNCNLYSKILEHYKLYINQTNKTLTRIKIAKSMPTAEYIAIFDELISLLNQFRVLTAGHHGRCGDHSINRYLGEQHRNQLKLPLSKSLWYHGRPVMILQNNYELGLFNGDIGICLQTEGGRLQVFFENKTQGISVNMLSDEMVATAYAMTIHKSQGSEFEHVAISFDDHNARLLSQELIYTAVTRAKKQVSIFSTESAFTQALATPTVRQTGLSLQFEGSIE